MTLETPNRLRAVAVLLFDALLDEPAFSFRGQNGFQETVNTITVSAGAHVAADMQLVDSAKVDNDEGAIFVTSGEADMAVAGWITPAHALRGIAAFDDLPPLHAVVEAFLQPKISGWRFCVSVFGIQTEIDPIPGEPVT